MRTRTGRLLAGAVIVAALVGGCGSGPSRTDAAAVVGQDSISLAAAQSRIADTLGKPNLVASLRVRGLGPPDVGRATVTQMILHRLLEQEAAAQGVVVRDDEVNALVAQVGDSSGASTTGDSEALAESARDQLLATRLAEKQLDRLEISGEIAVVQTRDEAVALGRALAAGGPGAQAALSRTDGVQPVRQIRPSATPQALQTPLIGIPAGGVAVYQESPQQGWVVMHVTERRTDAPAAQPAAASRLDGQSLFEAGIRLLTPTVATTDITVNPRYGTWDPVNLTVVGDPSQVGILIPGPASAPAAG